MPSVSKAQQKLFGLVKAVKAGKVKPSAVSPEVKKIAKEMPAKEIDKFAATKHKGLPEKKKKTEESLRSLIRNVIKETLKEESITEAPIPSANAHPWVINAMRELNDDLTYYLGDKPNLKIDWRLLKTKMNQLTQLINKYHK